MEITLFDTNEELIKCWQEDFKDYLNITAKHASLEDLEPHDCIINPGNSYGIMNGGIDLAIRAEVGIETQDAVQWAIVNNYKGQQPVGTCILAKVEKTGSKFAYLAHTPTMQVPDTITDTLNVAHAFHAAL